jgi:hypothetical protein
MTVMRLPLRTLLGAIGLAAASLATAADSFTVGVLSCAAESDRDRRLECYDRAVAGYTAALATGKRDSVAGVAPPAVASPGIAATPARRAAATGSSTPPRATGASAVVGSTPAVAEMDAPGVVGSSPAVAEMDAPEVVGSSPAVPGSAPADVPAVAPVAPAAPRHVAARISSIEHFPDYIVVHLDNQQAWKQVSDSPGSLVLRNGDSVTIDRQMASYWLAGPKGEAVQVRLETPQQ